MAEAAQAVEPVAMEDTIASEWTRIQGEMNPAADKADAPDTKDDDSRDESGRFRPKIVEKDTPAPEPLNDTDVITTDPVIELPATDKLMPVAWRKEKAEVWAALPDAAKEEVLKREADVRQGFNKYKTDAEIGQKFNAVVQPYMATLRQLNASPEQAVQVLFNADHAMRYGNPQQKAAMLKQLIADYQIDQSLLYQEQPQVDPRVQQLEAEVQRMKQAQASQQTQYTAQQQQQIEHEIADFAYEKDASGHLVVQGYNDQGNPVYKPKAGREHFETVNRHMGALMSVDPQLSLDDAYTQAVYALPNTRQALLQQQQAQQREEALKKAKAAKESSAINVRKGGAIDPTAAVGSMDDTIRQEAIRLGLAT